MFRDTDDRISQPRVSSDASPVHLDSGLNTSLLCVNYSLDSRGSSFRLVGCQGTMGRMWSVPVVPIRIRVETSLNCLRARRHRRTTPLDFTSLNTRSRRIQILGRHRSVPPPSHNRLFTHFCPGHRWFGLRYPLSLRSTH